MGVPVVADYGEGIDLSYDWPVPVDVIYSTDGRMYLVNDGVEGVAADNGTYQDLTEAGGLKVGYGIERYFNPITWPLITQDVLEPIAYSHQEYMESLADKAPGWTSTLPMGPTDAVEQKLLENYIG